ncbi:hypothetical protein AB0A74_00055 [Saccharothrix sp. NPDC042600]|uniref:hypothetical protein n=1 Tax=Saccharothrix TaxID=2071 RepID=UPI0033DD8796
MSKPIGVTTPQVPRGGPRDEAVRRNAAKATKSKPATGKPLAQRVPSPLANPRPGTMPQSLRLAEAAAQKESQTAREYAARRKAMDDLQRTAAGRAAYAESQRPSGQKPTVRPAPKPTVVTHTPAQPSVSQSLHMAEAAAQKESQTAREYAARRKAMDDLQRTAAGRAAYAESQRPSGQKPTIRPAPKPTVVTHTPAQPAVSQSLRMAEAAAQKESQTAREYAARRKAMEDLQRTAAGRAAYAESQRGGAPGTAARKAKRDLEMQIAQGMVDYHDAIAGRPVGQRDAQIVEKVDDKHTRVTNARTGQSAVLDMPLSGYLHPTSKSVEADMNTVVNGEPVTQRQTLKVEDWRKPRDPRHAGVSIGETADGRTVAVSQGNLAPQVKDQLRDSWMLGPEHGKSTSDGRTVTVFQRKQQIEHNTEDLGKQWGESVKDGKLRPGELGQAVAGSAALASDFALGMGGTNVYGTGKDCLGSGKNCGDFAAEAGLMAVGATPLKGVNLARPAVSAATRGGSAAVRAERAAEKAAENASRTRRSSAPRDRKQTETPSRPSPTPENPRTSPTRENPQRTSPDRPVAEPLRASPDAPRTSPNRDPLQTPRATPRTPSRNAAPDNAPNRPSPRASKDPVKPLDVGTYADLKKRERVGDGLEHDHIPSSAALKKAREKQLNRKLTKEEAREIHRQGVAIEVPKEVHARSETFRGRNTPERIEIDASDLTAAAERDYAAARRNLIDHGYSPEFIEAAIDLMRQLNRRRGI